MPRRSLPSKLFSASRVTRRSRPARSFVAASLVLPPSPATALYRAVAGEGGNTRDAATKLRAGLDRLVTRLAEKSFDGKDLRGILSGLIDDGLAGHYNDYAGAEQATMAIGSVLNFLARRGELKQVRSANTALDRMHAEVRKDETFRPERFRAALEGLGKTVR